MCTTPAPELTASVAGRIWSGVGEVNTAPGTAASSMPRPTYPPCSGSCPLPPPEASPTFPATGASLRTMYFGSGKIVTRSACASPNPSTDSSTTALGSLMSFFMAVLPGWCPGCLFRPYYRGTAGDRLPIPLVLRPGLRDCDAATWVLRLLHAWWSAQAGKCGQASPPSQENGGAASRPLRARDVA